MVKVGQIVKVQVLAVDPKSKRIGLSMKALMAPAGGGGGWTRARRAVRSSNSRTGTPVRSPRWRISWRCLRLNGSRR